MNASFIKGFFESISQLWLKHEFEDFRVIVEGDIYTCHSVILAGVSEFFAGLLRSNMKEKKEMEVHLVDISSATFKQIINTIYTGCELLTEGNVIEIWEGVHQLQIKYLIIHCEDFIVKNLSLDNIEKYRQRAEFLQSERIADCIFNFLLTNFELLTRSKMFRELDYQYLTKLISNDKLVVSSEDLILQSIFDWVDSGNICTETIYGIQPPLALKANDLSLNAIDGLGSTKQMEEPSRENACTKLNCNLNVKEQSIDLSVDEETPLGRRKFLISLLRSTRCFLASDTCIVRLYNNSLIQNDIMVKELLFKALTFILYNNCHGHWPATAIHRDCSEVYHVGVMCLSVLSGSMYAVSLKQKGSFIFKSLPIQQNVNLTIFRKRLYACSKGSALNEMYVFQNKVWVRLAEISHAVQQVLAHEKYIYIFDSNEKRFTRINPEISPIKLETFKHEIRNMAYALSFHNNIVVFASVDNNGVEETAVSCWNAETQVWTQLDNLQFSSRNMTSFSDDFNTYILDSNGNLWTLTNTYVIGFRLVATIWNGHVKILGAVLFRKVLFLFMYLSSHIVEFKCAKDVISSVKHYTFFSQTSNVVHYVVPKSELE